MRTAPLLTCLAILSANVANAQSLEAAQAAFDEGRFAEAAEIAEALNTSDGYTLAAESLAIHGYYFAEDDKKQALFERATQLAREAVRLDPRNPDAHLHLAHALGRYTQTVELMEAFDEGYPELIRETLEEALRLSPDMAAAHFSLASWHAEARHGGGIMAGILYGASEEDARVHFERAFELAPHDITTLFQYAHGLLLMDRNSNYGQARELLARAVEIPPKDAYNRIIHKLAAEQLEALEAQPPEPSQHPSRLGR